MRTIFGNIISEKNLEPKSNTEYIYDLDTVWEIGKLESIKIEEGKIVENVVQEEAGGYSFNIKGEEKKYRCNYGWAFIENTKENIELLAKIEEENQKLKEQEMKIKELKNKLTSLFKDYN